MEKDWVLSHIAVGLRELDETIDYYESTGVGIHTPIPVPKGPPPPDAKIPDTLNLRYGKVVEGPAVGTGPGGAASIITFIQIGDLQYECGKRGVVEIERSDHICFNVPDLYAESAPLIEKGCPVSFVYIKDSLIEENHIETKVGGLKLSFRPDPDGKRSEREKARRESLPISNWKFRGMGIAVNDMDKVVEHYQFLGVGTFQPEVMFDSSSIADFKVNGKTPDTVIKARTRMAQIGPVVYEFTQPLEGETIYKEALDSRGEGVNDFVFTVDDLDKETAKLAEKGVPVIRSGNPRNGGAFAYLDIRKVGGMMIKLIQA